MPPKSETLETYTLETIGDIRPLCGTLPTPNRAPLIPADSAGAILLECRA